MTRSAPTRSGNKIAWLLLTASISLLTGLILADHSAILTKVLGEPASASQLTERFEQRFEQHVQLPGHPVDHTMLEVVTQDLREIKQDVKELLRLSKKGG